MAIKRRLKPVYLKCLVKLTTPDGKKIHAMCAGVMEVYQRGDKVFLRANGNEYEANPVDPEKRGKTVYEVLIPSEHAIPADELKSWFIKEGRDYGAEPSTE